MRQGVRPAQASGAARTRDAWAPLWATSAYWNWLGRSADIWWTRQRGPRAVEAAQRLRLARLVDYTRRHSAYYRRIWPARVEAEVALGALPAVTKHALMAHFDEWVTDPAVTRERVDAFLADPAQVGSRFLGRYVVWKSSGSTGVPGVFVQDDDALATYDALIAAQFGARAVTAEDLWGVWTQSARGALIAATGEHFAGIASWLRFTRASPWFTAQHLSVNEPVERLVAALNAYRPTFVASYPTVLALLAEEQMAGRLCIAPRMLWSGGEHLAMATQRELEHAFGCPVCNEYGASECMSIAYGCREGVLHLNADWVILEPVDRHYRSVPPGEPSHTVLLTNLANRVQPLVRYDLGDSIVMQRGTCACGSPLPALSVEGRRDDILTLRAADGTLVRLPPLAVATVIEEAADVHRFQLLQVASDALRLRLPLRPAGLRLAAWDKASRALAAYLASQGLSNVTVDLDARAPQIEPASGKLREVVAERPPAH